MIAGIGTDIVKVSRIIRLLGHEKDCNVSVFLTPDERQMKKSARSFAGILAAKEALLKALGIGFTQGLGRLVEIEIRSGESGKPKIHTSGKVRVHQEMLGIGQIQLSISHDGDYAVAFVICEHTSKNR